MTVYLLMVCGIAFAGWGHAPALPLLGWTAAAALLGSASAWQQHRFRRTPDAHGDAGWGWRFAAMSAGHGILWGLGPALMYDPADGPHALVPVFVAAIFAIGATQAKVAIPLCAHLTYLPALALAAAKLVSLGGGHMALAAFLMVIALCGFSFTRSGHRITVESLRLSLANADLVAELSAAMDKAEAASRAKTMFLAAVGHELRTPLTAMLGVTDLLAPTLTDGRQREHLDILDRANRHMLGLTDDFLDFARLEAGDLAIEPCSADIGALVAEVTGLLSAAAADKAVELTASVADGGRPLRVCDPRRLRQVLVNLVHNAIKFTDIGRVSISVRAQAGDTVEFRVEDDGRGISEAFRAAIFEPFTQVEDGDRRRQQGVGLGLAISRRLVERMGGRLWLETPERGSRFCFSLDLPAADSAMPAAADRPAPRTRRAGCVLVVDDDPLIRRVLADMTARCGATVDTAENGAVAIAKAGQRPYDLVLMDQQMPGMTGAEALAVLRRQAGERGAAMPPVVAMTAAGFGDSREAALAQGFDDYLIKPLSSASLGDLLARFLPEASAAAPAGGPADITADEVMARCRSDCAALRAAIRAGAAAEAEYLAHRLKGLLLLAQMHGGARACAKLESAAPAGDCAAMGDLVERLAELIETESPRWPPMSATTVVIADDHDVARLGLRTLLAGDAAFAVVAEAADGIECVRAAVRCQPEIVILDLAMPRMTGADVIYDLRRRCPKTRVVVLTGVTSAALRQAAIEAGADAVLTKDGDSGDILATLRRVAAGPRRPREAAAPSAAPHAALSRRERQVLKLIVEGRRTRDIAATLALSERTVEKHRASLSRKLGASSPAEVAALALREGLVEELPEASPAA